MLEPNNIYHGDCYELIKEIPDKSIDLVYIDIPYKYPNGGYGHSKLAQRLGKHKENINDLSSGINYSILNELIRVMKYIYIYIWCSKDQINDLLNYFKPYKCRFNILVWCKTNPIPATNNTWLSDIEYCLVFKEHGAPRYNDGYHLKHKWYVSKINQQDKKAYGHPTIKPLELVKQHLLHSTQEGDIVLDCFLGSGTTCVASKELGRRYIGIELREDYYNIAKNRINEVKEESVEDIIARL